MAENILKYPLIYDSNGKITASIEKFDKISHFVLTLFNIHNVISKKVGDVFKFCGLLTISELYDNPGFRLLTQTLFNLSSV